jgi:hypothetical protein
MRVRSAEIANPGPLRALRFSALIALALASVACSRSDGHRSLRPDPDLRADGWVEFTLLDRAVPADPIGAAAGRPARAPTCELLVDLDGESVLSEVIHPTGTTPPYSVESTFRFSAPPGEHGAAIYYSGCRAFGRRPDSVEAALRISVRGRHVTRIRFDGSILEADAPSDPRRGRGGR